MHTTGVEEYSNSTEKIIGCEKAESGISGRLGVEKWIEDKKIHRKTAELEWEIPEIIAAAIYDKGQE